MKLGSTIAHHENKQWTATGEATTKKAKTVFSADKVLTLFFGTCKALSLLIIFRRVESSMVNILRRVIKLFEWLREGKA